MTLTHYIGGRIIGQDIDQFPSTNYPEFSTFINTETLVEWILIAGVWQQIGVLQAIYQEDFSNYADQAEADLDYPSSDVSLARVDIVNFWLNVDDISNGTNDSCLHDLGFTLDDTMWLMRFKHHTTTVATRTSTSAGVFWGMFSTDQTSSAAIAQDSLVIQTNCSTSVSLVGLDTDDLPLVNLSGATGFTPPVVPTNGTDRWIEIIRNSATEAIINVYSDPTFETQIATATLPMSAGTIGLRFIGGKNFSLSDASSRDDSYITDVKIWDGINVLP